MYMYTRNLKNFLATDPGALQTGARKMFNMRKIFHVEAQVDLVNKICFMNLGEVNRTQGFRYVRRVVGKSALRSLSLSYPKKDCRAGSRKSFFGYSTDYKIVLFCTHIFTDYILWSLSYQRIGRAPPTNPSFGMTTTKILRHVFPGQGSYEVCRLTSESVPYYKGHCQSKWCSR